MKRSFLFTLILVATSTLLFTGCDVFSDLTSKDEVTEADDGITLFPVRIDGDWGYINQEGRIMIEPRFDAAGQFSGGLAQVRNSGRLGYIDAAGEYVIEPRFQNGRPFVENLAAVEIDGRWGYINRSGAFAINPQFHDAFDFSQGRAFVRSPSFDWEYIDTAGNIIRTVETPRLENFDELSNDFIEDRALVFDFDLDQYGYIDPSGNVAIEFQYSEARSFSEGLAAIKISDSWGFIDKSNNTVISPRFIEAGNFGDGLVPVRQNTNTWGYADRSGNMVIDPQFDEAREFSEGRAAVAQNGFWGYIDKSGRYITQPEFDTAEPFYKGLGAVVIERINPENQDNRVTTYGYIGSDGKYTWFPTN